MKKLIFTAGFIAMACAVLAQAPAAFNYQATARTSSGEIIAGEELTIRVGILLNNVTIWEEDHVVVTNQQGHFSIKIGSDEAINGSGNAGSFADIDWGTGSYSVNLKVDNDTGFSDLGDNELLSVPYALYAADGSYQSPWLVEENFVFLADPKFNLGVGTNVPSAKFIIEGGEQPDDFPLFEVRNYRGESVLSGFNNGAFINVEPGGRKGLKGGFAVGGYNTGKAEEIQEFFRVTSDSIRVTINDAIQRKGLKGGFAVGGYNSEKAEKEHYFYVDQFGTEINGNLNVTGEFTRLSDASLKSNILEIDHVLDKLQQLRGVYFDWNQLAKDTYSVNNRNQIGVLAQELESVYPELVITNDKGYRMVDYSKLTPVLLQAIKEQQQQIDALQEREQKISELEDRIAQLEQLMNQ
ncbi:MAG: tail fiber domain-containing protein [Bacteroidales bacterium]